MITQANLTALSKEDALAIRRHLARSAFVSFENVSPLVRSLLDVLTPEQLSALINNDVMLMRAVYAQDTDGDKLESTNHALLLRFNELEDLPLPPYAIDRYPIYERGVNLLYGLPGIGKSFIAVDFIGHLAVAQPNKAIIYIAPEGWSSIPVRWKAWCKHYRAEPKNTYIMRQSLRLSDASAINAFKEACQSILKSKVHFIVIDTLARAMTGDNENDTREMNLVIDATERLRADLDCGVLFIHHVNKQGLLRGSTVLEGALDSVIKVQRDERQLVLFNAQDKGGKNRHREEMPPIYLNMIDMEIEAGGTTSLARVIEVGEKVIQTPSQDTLTARQKELLEALDGYDNGMTVKQLQETTSIPKPTIYRYAKLLQQAGYLKHDREKDSLLITNNGKSAYRESA